MYFPFVFWTNYYRAWEISSCIIHTMPPLTMWGFLVRIRHKHFFCRTCSFKQTFAVNIRVHRNTKGPTGTQYDPLEHIRPHRNTSGHTYHAIINSVRFFGTYSSSAFFFLQNMLIDVEVRSKHKDQQKHIILTELKINPCFISIQKLQFCELGLESSNRQTQV